MEQTFSPYSVFVYILSQKKTDGGYTMINYDTGDSLKTGCIVDIFY